MPGHCIPDWVSLPGISLDSKFKGLSETLVMVMVVLTGMLGRTGEWGRDDVKVNTWQRP